MLVFPSGNANIVDLALFCTSGLYMPDISERLELSKSKSLMNLGTDEAIDRGFHGPWTSMTESVKMVI